MSDKNLSTLTVADLDSAQVRSNSALVCPKGFHKAKVLSFTEEENYNYVSLEIEGKKYNFFYDYTLRDSDAFDRDVLNWIISLATIPVTPTTPLLAITNSAIGHTYEIETDVYTSKTGKNAGKEQHFIRFSTKPELTKVIVEEETLDLPF